MALSPFLSDTRSDFAHALKILSYGCVLIGLVVSMHGLFRRAEESAEEALEANRRLRELDRAKTEFIGIASHEIRSPLTSVAGFAQMLDRRWDRLGEARRREVAGRIHDQSARLVRLADDLLAMSRLDAGALDPRPEPVDLGDVVGSVAEELEDRVEDLELRIPEDLRVLADAEHLRQILVNYVTNAERYGAPPIRIEAACAGDGVEVVVADAGEGVPDEFVPRLFERFARAGTDRTGTGLGLAIVRGLARANAGDAFYEPNAPRGSRFGVRLSSVPGE